MGDFNFGISMPTTLVLVMGGGGLVISGVGLVGGVDGMLASATNTKFY